MCEPRGIRCAERDELMVLVKGLQEQVAELKAANEELQRQLAESQRVCGGTRDAGMGARATHGLSPRVRGNLRHLLVGQVGYRSIPACAGEPPYRRLGSPQAPVYPRVCGGTYRINHEVSVNYGLSPRVRGNLHVKPVGVAYVGSIPACAGEPALRRWPGCP